MMAGGVVDGDRVDTGVDNLRARHAAPEDFILGLDGEQQDRTANG